MRKEPTMNTLTLHGHGSRSIKNFVWNWRKRFCEYVSHCQTNGFIPYTFRPLQLVCKYLAKLWVFIQVGRISVIGKENLTPGGRVIFCPNHSSMFDAPVIFSIMRVFPRYMTALEEMRGLLGLKAIFMGACGSFPVDRSHGKAVLEPSIKVLLKGDPLVIFPEGKISATGQYLPFKMGAALIAIGAWQMLENNEKVSIVPIHICFHARHAKTACGPYDAMGFKWRKGATVTVCSPIWIDDLDSPTPDKLIGELRKAILEQTCPTTFDSGEQQAEWKH
jgi:1-acyl-sn-glycerol-3-phosphate acyltransferase